MLSGSVKIMLHFAELTFIPRHFQHEASSSLVDNLLNTAEINAVSYAYLISVDLV